MNMIGQLVIRPHILQFKLINVILLIPRGSRWDHKRTSVKEAVKDILPIITKAPDKNTRLFLKTQSSLREWIKIVIIGTEDSI